MCALPSLKEYEVYLLRASNGLKASIISSIFFTLPFLQSPLTCSLVISRALAGGWLLSLLTDGRPLTEAGRASSPTRAWRPRPVRSGSCWARVTSGTLISSSWRGSQRRGRYIKVAVCESQNLL